MCGWALPGQVVAISVAWICGGNAVMRMNLRQEAGVSVGIKWGAGVR